MRLFICMLLFLFATREASAQKSWLDRPAEHQGMCDASAAVAVSENHFLVASDEDNVLRIYSADAPGVPVRTFDLNGFLGTTSVNSEADLEGCARIGDRVYWIGSHGRNKDGKPRPNRHRFFAVDLQGRGPETSLVPVGSPCRDLLVQLARDPRYRTFGLAEGLTLAPKQELGLNIEGLCAGPNGELLIGFRNPIPNEHALLAPLLNPAAVVTGSRAAFGAPILLDLGGLGIRDTVFAENQYFIIAGPHDGGGPFRFYQWDGSSQAPRRIKVEKVGDYKPEVAVVYPNTGLREIQLLSDDGTRVQRGRPCKELKGTGSFRSVWMTNRKAGT